MSIKVIINYKSLEYFITTKKLIRHQTYRVKFLLEFNFIIFYILDKKKQKADLLTHCPNYLPLDNNNNC